MRGASSACQVLDALAGVGLTRKEEEMILLTDEPKIPGYLCYPNDGAADRYGVSGVFGQGFHTDDSLSRVKAVAECLERLCLQNPQEDSFVVGRYVPGEYADPALFRSYSAEQVTDIDQYVRDVRGGSYRWWRVTELSSGAQTAIPAQMVFISEAFRDEVPIRGEQISTGAAIGKAGPDRAAFTAGLFETIERDACISAYLSRANLRRIVGLPEDLLELVDQFERYELEPNIFDVTTDVGIPTVLALTLDRTGLGPAVNTGSHASGSYRNAIHGALLESIHCRRTMRFWREMDARHPVPSETEVTSLDQRFNYWYPVERIKDLAFWLESDRQVSYADLAGTRVSVPDAVKRILDKGYHLFVADMSLPEIRAAGFETLKVIIPEFHPLYLDDRAKYLYSVHHGDIPDDRSLKPHPFT